MIKSSQLRSLLSKKTILKVMGAHNALGAKLIERHGFDAVWSSGFEIATAHGVPDANILTMTENLDAAININSATHLPTICDCDTGYGNANNVMHMVRKYESAGMAALVIEDKRFPKVNSFIPGRQELASIEEFCGRLQAARAVQSSDNGVMIFARLEALIAGWGVDEAYRRAAAYYEAGAEGFVIHSKLKNPSEIFAFSRMWNKNFKNACPLVAIPTTYFNVTTEELVQEGFRVVIYANQGMRASVRAMEEVFEQIEKEGTTRNVETRIASMDELFKLQGMPTYQEHEQLYSGESEKISVVIPAAADHKFQPELSALLQEQPLCLVQLGNKSILEHQVTALKNLGASDFNIVIGYQSEKMKEKIRGMGIKAVENSAYSKFGSAWSVMQGIQPDMKKALVTYSDIVFDQLIAESLLQSKFPITLVIDRAFRTLPRRDKKPDLVITEEESSSSTRKMEPGNFKKIKSIGKSLESEAGYEFIGMMLFNQEGLAALRNAWVEALQKFNGKKFYESSAPEMASMTDLLQYLMDRGTEVRGFVIEHGWSELYSLEDYQRLERYFSEKQTEFAVSRS